MRKKISKIKKSENLTPETLGVPCKKFLKNVGLSQSLIRTFQECPRKFLFKINGYRSIEKRGKYLFGSIFHEILDYVYGGKKYDSTEFEKYFRKNKMKEFEGVDETQIELDFSLAAIMSEAYFERYKDDFTEKKFDGIEEEFTIPFEEFRLLGKKDGCFYLNDKRWLMEHKTISRFNEDALMMRLSYDFQNLLYILADETENKEPIAGVLYNVLRKPQLRKGKTETLKTFADRVRADVDKRPEWYFIRWEIPYTSKDKKRFKIELRQKLKTIANAIEYNSFYKCENACDGIFTCEYLPSCAANSFINLTKNGDIFPELGKVNPIKHKSSTK